MKKVIITEFIEDFYENKKWSDLMYAFDEVISYFKSRIDKGFKDGSHQSFICSKIQYYFKSSDVIGDKDIHHFIYVNRPLKENVPLFLRKYYTPLNSEWAWFEIGMISNIEILKTVMEFKLEWLKHIRKELEDYGNTRLHNDMIFKKKEE